MSVAVADQILAEKFCAVIRVAGNGDKPGIDFTLDEKELKQYPPGRHVFSFGEDTCVSIALCGDRNPPAVHMARTLTIEHVERNTAVQVTVEYNDSTAVVNAGCDVIITSTQ